MCTMYANASNNTSLYTHLSSCVVWRVHPLVVWRGSKSKHHKDACSKEIGLRLQILITTLHSIVNIIERTYLSNLDINKHANAT